ncbi:hypothetical protein AC578_7521 [Pseudocercospora eumusae]|uniref:Uncharacterized protein n=1 Tax=Pseudocercospora eumusae TaxID=321146 RepID=A0A139GWM3_9PEZI|nr:hypothetical protein AC578_7521 [Pseudocercospora eumusae]
MTFNDMSANSTPPAEVKVTKQNIRTALQPISAEAINFHDDLFYCEIAKVDPASFHWLAEKDIKLAEKATAEYVKSQNDLISFAKISNRKFLVKAENGKNYDNVKQAEYSAIVICWTGNGFPPEELSGDSLAKAIESLGFGNCLYCDDKFCKAWNTQTQKEITGRRWHWTKILLFERNKKHDEFIAELSPTLINIIGNSYDGMCFQTAHIPMKVAGTSKVLNLTSWLENRPAVEDRVSDSIDGKMWEEVTTALLAKKYNPDDKATVVVHGHKFFDLINDKSMSGDPHGLRLCQGTERRLGATSSNALVLYEGISNKLFFKPDGTVADFMLDFFGDGRKLERTLRSCLDEMNEALVGKTVRFRVNGRWEVRKISEVTTKRAATCSLDDPELPALNLGTSQYHEYMPPEKCFLVPGQSFRRPKTPILQREVALFRRTQTNPAACGTSLGQAGYVVQVAMPSKDERKMKLHTLVQRAFQSNMEIGFLEVGVKKPSAALWGRVRNILASDPTVKAHASNQSNVDPVFIPYSPAKHSREVIKHQLQSWKNQGNVGNKKIIAVVLLPDDEYSDQIYKVMKELGDTEVGIQTYFLKDTSPNLKDDVGKVIGEICKRVAVRNIPVDQRLTGGSMDLTVAIQVSDVQVTVPFVATDTGKRTDESYTYHLISAASRLTEDSSGYHTTVYLADPADFSVAKVADCLGKHFQGFIKPTSAKVTILRSGKMPPKVWTGQKMIEIKNAESSALSAVVAERLGKGSEYSYVFLSSHRDAINPISKGPSAVDGVPDALQKATFYVTDTSSHQEGHRSMRVHHVTSKSGETTAIQLEMIENRTSSPVGTKSTSPVDSHHDGIGFEKVVPHRPLARKVELSLMEEDRASVGSSKSSRSTSPTDTEFSADSGKTTSTRATSLVDDKSLSGKKSKDEIRVSLQTFPASVDGVVSDAELTRLAKMWTDESLDLYNTKWPIPTHLAHLALERAKIHLRTEAWINSQNEAKCFLPAVHKDIADTLYYL